MKAQLVLIPLTVMASMAMAKTKIGSKDLLTRLHDANQAEIAAGKLAEQKAQSPSVKKFGKHLLKDHKQADAEVLALAKEEGIDLNASMPSSLGEAGQSMKGSATLADLRILSGPEFDRAFVKNMDRGHTDVIQLLETSEITDPKVQKLADQLLPKLKEHRKIAQNLEPSTDKE